MAEEPIETPYQLPSDPGIKVYANPQNQIVLRQESLYGEEDHFIFFSPDRADRVIQFIQAIRDELLTEGADKAEAAQHARPVLNKDPL